MLRALFFLSSLLSTKVGTHIKNERGATAVEYGLMVALIAVVIISAVTLLGENLASTFHSVAQDIGSAGS